VRGLSAVGVTGYDGSVQVHPVTADRWTDLYELFGERGAYSGCWCMYWRVTGGEFEAGCRGKGAGNRARFEALVAAADPPPGVLAYDDGRVVGWCSAGPREDFGRLQRSPNLKPVDDTPVWSVVCFYIDRHHRRQGVSAALLDGAVELACAHGAAAVEGYPVDTGGAKAESVSLYTGVPSMFERAGFVEVARRKDRRPVFRLTLT
jgi:GNAT superfamily N-acetyltransferase